MTERTKYRFLFWIFLIGCNGFLSVCSAGSTTAHSVRNPAVAGKFYSSDPIRLRLGIEKYWKDARPKSVQNPIALVAPHAGYIFSGQICADAYRQTEGETYDLVVVLGTNHSLSELHKIGFYTQDEFCTPLGCMSIDSGVRRELLAEYKEGFSPIPIHDREHSVEVQVPFIQVLLPKARLLPLIVGSVDDSLCNRLASAFVKILKGRKTLFIASSDLSHYPPADEAKKIDEMTLKSMAGLDGNILRHHLHTDLVGVKNLGTKACGEAPLLVAMHTAKLLGATNGAIISYAHSGHTILGDPDQVVGYGAVVFSPSRKMPASGSFKENRPGEREKSAVLSPSDKKALLHLARETLDRYFQTETLPFPRDFSLAASNFQGAFVTLSQRGKLRGCVGRMVSDLPLFQTVGKMAWGAAFEDTRFSPLNPGELSELEIEISVLTPLQTIKKEEEIQIGRDGVQLRKGPITSVFLPQVAGEQGWNRRQLLENLCRKAGLENDCWQNNAKLSIFQADVFHEDKETSPAKEIFRP